MLSLPVSLPLCLRLRLSPSPSLFPYLPAPSARSFPRSFRHVTQSVLGKYETIKDERSGTGTSGGSSSCNSGRSDSIIPGVSNEVLCTELERDIAAVAETLDGGGGDPNGTTAVGTPAPHLDTSNNGNGSRNSSSDSNGINSNGGNGRACSPGNPSTVHQQQPVEQLESYPEAPSPAPRAPSILVVDDSQMSCKLAKRCLSKAKFHVEVREGGREEWEPHVTMIGNAGSETDGRTYVGLGENLTEDAADRRWDWGVVHTFDVAAPRPPLLAENGVLGGSTSVRLEERRGCTTLEVHEDMFRWSLMGVA